MDFKGKRAVVTGAGSGIGRAIVRELVSRGARVLASDIDEVGIAETARGFEQSVATMRCDVSDHRQVEALAERAITEFARLDLVFANAGVIASGSFMKMTPEEVDWILGVNVRGAWSTASVFAKVMKDQPEGGRICFTGSEHSLGFQHPGAAVYTASKHAVLGLAEVLRAEMPASIKVSVFCPGLVGTALGTGFRPAHLRQPRGNPELNAKVQARGMTPDVVARHAVDGVARGDFYIVTHPHTVRAAERRIDEIHKAFSEQAPWSDDADRYDVNRVLSEVMAEISGKGQ